MAYSSNCEPYPWSRNRFVNDEILQQHDEAAFRCADGKEQIDHSRRWNDRAGERKHGRGSAARKSIASRVIVSPCSAGNRSPH